MAETKSSLWRRAWENYLDRTTTVVPLNGQPFTVAEGKRHHELWRRAGVTPERPDTPPPPRPKAAPTPAGAHRAGNVTNIRRPAPGPRGGNPGVMSEFPEITQFARAALSLENLDRPATIGELDRLLAAAEAAMSSLAQGFDTFADQLPARIAPQVRMPLVDVPTAAQALSLPFRAARLALRTEYAATFAAAETGSGLPDGFLNPASVKAAP